MTDSSRASGSASDATAINSQHQRLLKLATYASVATAGLLIIIKLLAWFITGSMSLMATLLDSTMDILASLVTLFAVRIAIAPADDDHHFGHGKAEYLAVLAQSTFIAGSAIVLILTATNRILEQSVVVQREGIGIAVMVVSIAATLLLVAIQQQVIRKTGSAAIRADSLHYQMDLLINATVLLTLTAAALGYHQFDNFLALIIGGYMLHSVRPQAWEAIQQLMDTSLPESDLQEIKRRALSVDGVRGIHEIRTRVSGSVAFIQMHLDLDGCLPLRQAHDIGFRSKQAVLDYLPRADVMVHLDPED